MENLATVVGLPSQSQEDESSGSEKNKHTINNTISTK